MSYGTKIIDQVESLYRVIKFIQFRRTDKVTFDMFSTDIVGRIDAIDKVIHGRGAISPGPVAGVARPWYMHPHQEDNLMVMHGIRYIQIYTPKHGHIENFTVYPDRIYRNDELICDGPAVLNWPRGVFHRIVSCEEEGSVSLNFAVHDDQFDINTNFNIYDLNPDTGQYIMLRAGHEDQFFPSE